MPDTFRHLRQPLSLGPLRLQNRLVMGSMHTGLEDGPGGYKRLAEFYLHRARAGVGMIVTGGVSPDFRGRLSPFASQLSHPWHCRRHRYVTERVHQTQTRICLQLLHAGRYAMHPFAVAPSAIRAPVSRFTPAAMSERQIRKTIDAFVNSACLARASGYDGVEIMGSEGYLLNQFSCLHSNHREDDWGGGIENRIRLSVEIVRRIRQAVGDDWLIIYRLSMLDLLPDGNDWDEVVFHARAIEAAGASLLNTGIGWHEVRIPTIAAMVPEAAFSWVSEKMKQAVGIPVITSNRINRLEVAERCLADGQADLVSMARPFLADARLAEKIHQPAREPVNTCIACNQSCLDQVFRGRQASCLVNPVAGYETKYRLMPAREKKTVVVVGLGMAGLSCALTAAQRGHRVIAYEAGEAGGQFNLAARIPGKQDYARSVDYFLRQLKRHDVELRLHEKAGFTDLRDRFFDACVIATGVEPRIPDIEGVGHFSVMTYEQAIAHRFQSGQRIVIIGAGGIGFDVAEKCITDIHGEQDWYRQWGIDRQYRFRGGLLPVTPVDTVSPASGGQTVATLHQPAVYLLQRKAGKPGAGLGKTTGWIHRLQLKQAGVTMLSSVEYRKIDDAGLHIVHQGKSQTIAAEHIILCCGQVSRNRLYERLRAIGQPVYRIGGAASARELDAARAIRDGMELAMRL